MSRLPTVGGDQNNWGTVLNDFLSVSLNSDGTLKGTAGGGPLATSYTLAGNTAAGDQTISLSGTPPSWIWRDTYLVINPGSVTCEIRRPSNVSGNTVTLQSTLWRPHSSGDVVVLMFNAEIPLAFWGARGNNSADDGNAIQAGLDQSSLTDGMWITGLNITSIHRTTHPLCHTSLARVKQLRVDADPSFAPAETAGALWMCSNHPAVEFSASASTDTFTITQGSTSAAAADDKIVFQDPLGQGLPSPIQAGKVYYVKTWSGTGPGGTFTVTTSPGGATLDLTTNGAGRAYQKINGLGRPYLNDVYVVGQNVAGLNGYRMCVQQPFEARKVRADNCPGTGIIIGESAASAQTQQGEFYNIECISNGVGAEIYGLGGNFHYLDCETNTTGAIIAGNDWKFYGPHFEGNTQDVQYGFSSGAQARACGFYGGYFGATGADAAHAPFTVVSGDGASGYQLVNCHFGGAIGAGKIIINDLSARSKQLLYDNLASVQAELGYLYQPIGSTSNWVFLDGSPTFLPKVRTVVTFTSIAAGATQDQTVTVTGAVTGNRVVATPEATIASLVWFAYVSSSNTVTIRMYNPTAGSITPSAVNWDVNVLV